MNDTRKNKRIDLGFNRVNATLAILQPNATTGCVVAIQDLSKSGVGCYIKSKIPRGCSVQLTVEGLNLPPLKGKVVWVCDATQDANTPQGHPFRVGIDFTPEDDADRENQINIYAHFAELRGK